ncbi:hypothetical protein [Pedobacter sp. MC2016-24]|uniref:hypothetical protein n=1 Tax=Pedobacter sp. MC2016-24 TaxID=2780090 RepID=UPI001882428D|nr:hypothetical protein [Pedobacter sp. MC2016-24]MBE9599912.1 hypothetical protein [Pedobacter sp. MC2016-24]
MSNFRESKNNVKAKVEENYRDLEEKKRIKMLNLIAEIISKAILKELYEKSN